MALTNFKQQNVTIFELVLPYCTVCTPANGYGTNQWHTPVTCEESSDSTYSLFFTHSTAPAPMQQPHSALPGIKSILNSKVHHVVNSASPSTAMLKPGEGLASRSTISMSMTDFDGDPGPINFTDDGTFFGKLRARNILIGKKIIAHNYSRINPTDTLEFQDDSTYFITSTDLTGGIFSVSAKDALKDIEVLSDKFPDPSDIELAEDIDSSTTSFEISDATGFANGDVIRIGSELLRLNADPVDNVISTYTRGQGFSVDDIIVYKTEVDSHSDGDTVQPCYLMLGYAIYDVLLDLFTAAGLEDYTDYDQWKEEIDEWSVDSKLYGVLHTSASFESTINAVLSNYMVDMWLDQPTQKLVASTTTVWKDEKRQITEGDDFSDLSIKDLPDKRYSRAMIYNYKEYKTADDDPTNYSKLILRTDTEKETSDYYGDIRLNEFDPSEFMTNGDAISLCQRYIQRFSTTPRQLSFTMEERKLADTVIGDVVDVISRGTQTAAGLTLTSSDRIQITRIQPDLNTIGRKYKVTGMSYVPQITSGDDDEYTITLSGSLYDVDLFAEAGKPNLAINVTFVFDGASIGSTSTSFYSMTAAGFADGTRIRIILINGATWSAIGGDGGGDSQSSVLDGGDGGDSYNSSEIETEIYINYPSIAGYSASSTVYASGGGGASYGGLGGGGGSGIPAGSGSDPSFPFPDDAPGNDGTFESGGSGSTFTNQDGVYYFAGDGGASSIGGGSGYDSIDIADGGLAGYAFVGGSITIYNTDSSKLRDGQNNGTGYTLITE